MTRVATGRRRSGPIAMAGAVRDHWVQYHLPAVMGYSINEPCLSSEFSALSAKAVETMGSVFWIVGRTTDDNLCSVYLSGWFVVEGVRGSSFPRLPYEYWGRKGKFASELPAIEEESWYRRLLDRTGNFEYGLTKITGTEVLQGLQKVARKWGMPCGFR